MAIFAFQNWPLATFVWVLENFCCGKIAFWPKLLTKWPKLGHKSGQKLTAIFAIFCPKTSIFGYFWAFFG